MHAVFVVICFLPTVILRTAQSRIQIAKSQDTISSQCFITGNGDLKLGSET